MVVGLINDAKYIICNSESKNFEKGMLYTVLFEPNFTKFEWRNLSFSFWNGLAHK